MASAQLGSVFRRIGRLFGSGSVVGLSEGQLLARFVDSRDEAAFEALVARYGPMVLGVCRQFLSDAHAVDDAFQATFLVLVKRARSIRDRELLGNWLYGVALKVARRARADQAKRRLREKEGSPVGAEPIGDGPDLSDLDLGPVLHEELAKLPEKYRAPMVLCYLDGRTHEEAAQQLGWPVGSVKGRIARAKDLLRSRLARRGVTASTALLAATLAKTSGAAVSPLLLDQTVKAAMALAAGGAAAAAGSASSAAVALAEGVVTSMIVSQGKALALGLVLVATLAGGAAVMARQGIGGGQEEKKAASNGALPDPGKAASPGGVAKSEVPELNEAMIAAAPKPDANLNIDDLIVEHVKQAKKNLEAQAAFYEQGQITLDRVIQAARTYLDARVQAAQGDPVASMAPVEEHVKFLKLIADREQAKFLVGQTSRPNLTEAELNLTEARILLAQAREMAAGAKSEKPKAAKSGKKKEMTPIPPEGGGGMAPAKNDLNANDGVESDDPNGDEKIAKALQKPISMPFQHETPLEEIVKYIQTATTGPEFERGIPIYVDQIGLQEAEKTMASPITINLEGIKLRTTLRLVLRQLDLGYYIKHGLLIITSVQNEEYKDATQPGWRERQRALPQAPGGVGGGGGFR